MLQYHICSKALIYTLPAIAFAALIAIIHVDMLISLLLE